MSLVMCPDRKLKWFKDHGRTPSQIRAIEETVVNMWNSEYAKEDSNTPHPHTSIPKVCDSVFQSR